MSKPKVPLEKFFVRWSRRKLAVAEHAAEEISKKQEGEQSSKSDGELPTFDPASLPPIELINAASDLRAFLAPGVTMGLTRAALRRAWVADPAIRDFIGIAENQWDFAKPDGVPGFGSLVFTSDLRRIVSELCRDPADVGQKPDNVGQSLERGDAPAGQAKQVPNQVANQPPVTPTATQRVRSSGQ